MDAQPRSTGPVGPAPCPVCHEHDGFHSAQIHAEVVIDPKLFKPKDWHKDAKDDDKKS